MAASGSNLRPPFDTLQHLEGTMAGIRLFDTHYLWEDIVSMGLGVLITLTSWILGEGNQMAAATAVIIGLVVVALGAAEFLDLRRWEESLETACGLWLIASPFIFGYADAGTLRYWHFALGAAVVLLAMLELRQDWKLSNAEIARHSARS
jgi:SPW repeat